MWDSQKLQEPADDYRQDVFRRFAAHIWRTLSTHASDLCAMWLWVKSVGFWISFCYLEHMLVFDSFFLLSALFKVQPWRKKTAWVNGHQDTNSEELQDAPPRTGRGWSGCCDFAFFFSEDAMSIRCFTVITRVLLNKPHISESLFFFVLALEMVLSNQRLGSLSFRSSPSGIPLSPTRTVRKFLEQLALMLCILLIESQTSSWFLDCWERHHAWLKVTLIMEISY